MPKFVEALTQGEIAATRPAVPDNPWRFPDVAAAAYVSHTTPSTSAQDYVQRHTPVWLKAGGAHGYHMQDLLFSLRLPDHNVFINALRKHVGIADYTLLDRPRKSSKQVFGTSPSFRCDDLFLLLRHLRHAGFAVDPAELAAGIVASLGKRTMCSSGEVAAIWYGQERDCHEGTVIIESPGPHTAPPKREFKYRTTTGFRVEAFTGESGLSLWVCTPKQPRGRK